MNANLFDSVRRISEEAPERIALIHRGNTLTYGELRKHVERRASELRRRGIGKGDRVVLFVPMGIRLYEILEMHYEDSEEKIRSDYASAP